jgi:class 3 adenylate cyclase/DNA-binding NarL/FixJ family response regulator
MKAMPGGRITVLLADDNLIVREGVRALLGLQDDIDVVGVAADYDELLARADEFVPEVLVTDIRMPPSFQSEGIEAAKEVRKRHPGTGVVILSQYDDPEYAIALLRDGSDGYAYLLKDRVAEGDELVKAIRAVATGSSVLDPKIVEALVRPVSSDGELSQSDEELLRMVAEGKPIKRIAAALGTTPAAVADDIQRLFLDIAKGASSGTAPALRRLQMLHSAIVEREEIGEQIEKLLPEGLAQLLRDRGLKAGDVEKLTVTCLMTDVRGYSRIAEETDSGVLARQLNEHRALLNEGIQAFGGTVMQYTGDGVLAVFGAPLPQDDHADRALKASLRICGRQADLNDKWRGDGTEAFEIGIGLSTGEVAAALLGSEDRFEYTLVGDTVNMSQRLQDLARPGGHVVISEATELALTQPPVSERIEAEVKGGRVISAYKIDALALNEKENT